MNGTGGPPQGKHIKPAVCACHCFTCILPPNSPVAKPPAASGWLLCYSAWQDHYRYSPLSICPVASQQHFTSSPLIQLLLPSPPFPCSPDSLYPPIHSPFSCTLKRPLCWLVWHLPFRRGKRDKPLSNLWPFPPLPLWRMTHSPPISLTINFTD